MTESEWDQAWDETGRVDPEEELQGEYICAYIIGKLARMPLTLEAFLRLHPEARTEAFVQWQAEFTARQARREHRE